MKPATRISTYILALTLLLSGTGCGSQPAGSADYTAHHTPEQVELTDEAVALSQSPAALPADVVAQAPGTLVKRSDQAWIDYSNTAQGYVTVCHSAETQQRLKAQVKGPTTTYTYDLTAQQQAVFPLSDGSGAYRITLYKNVEGSKYAAVLSLSCDVLLDNEFAPFLHANQYVDYDSAPNTVVLARQLTDGHAEALEKVAAVYDYVVSNLTYDKQLAATVKSGYLPDLDAVLEKKSGICFDYAALMTGMLRSQGIPCKLVVGFAGQAYHAWISVWSEQTGWINGAVFFDGQRWQRMDPTFASSGKGSQAIMDYIGDGKNYTARYFY